MTGIKIVPIAGYEEYLVSSDGKLYSRSFRNNRSYIPRMKELRQFDNGQGYKYVQLSKNGIRKRLYVHRIVAEHFIGAIPEGFTVNHKDMNRGNNSVDNLEYLTQGDNVRYSAHKMRHEKSRCNPTNTGHKYVRLYSTRNRKPVYRVCIKQIGVSKQFASLADAVKFRDEVMKDA